MFSDRVKISILCIRNFKIIILSINWILNLLFYIYLIIYTLFEKKILLSIKNVENQGFNRSITEMQDKIVYKDLILKKIEREPLIIKVIKLKRG